MNCYCGSNKEFSNCCEPLLNGERMPIGPEELMRSRYSAFCVKNMDYLVDTTDPQTRLTFDFEATKDWADTASFLKLEVLRSSEEGTKGVVEFKAHYQMPEHPPEIHHEISKFRKQAGRWYFREGKVSSTREHQ